MDLERNQNIVRASFWKAELAVARTVSRDVVCYRSCDAANPRRPVQFSGHTPKAQRSSA